MRRKLGWFGRLWMHLAGIAVTSVIATLATMPFSLYHFQQIQYYGVIANMIAVPVTSVWVMPAGMISYLAFPFGLEEWPLTVMGWGVTVILETARIVAALPGSTKLVPAMPPWGLALMVSGGLWLMLWRGRWRLWGLPVIALGVMSLAFTLRPDILIDDQGKLMAVREASGGLALSSKTSGKFDAGVWLRRDGSTESTVWPREEERRRYAQLRSAGMPLPTRRLYRRSREEPGCAGGGLPDSGYRDHARSGAKRMPRPCCDRPLAPAARWCPRALPLGPEPRVETVTAERGIRPWVPQR